MIKIIEDYYVAVDERQYIVGKLKSMKVKNPQTNEIEEKDVLTDKKYFSTLCECVQAVYAAFQRRGIQSTNGELKDAINTLKRVEYGFAELLSDCLPKFKDEWCKQIKEIENNNLNETEE